MRASTAVLSALTLIVGVGGGSVAYELASSVVESTGPTGTTGAPVVVDEAPATTVRGTRFRWAACEAPAALRGDTCVTTVVRTVVLPGPAAAVGTTAGGATAALRYQDDEGYDDDGAEDHDEGDDHDEGHDDHDEGHDDHDEGDDDDEDEDD